MDFNSYSNRILSLLKQICLFTAHTNDIHWTNENDEHSLMNSLIPVDL